MTACFVESSAVLGWLLNAPDAARIAGMLDEAPTVAASALTIAEVLRSLRRMVAAGTLAEVARERAITAFRTAAAQWEVHAVTDALIERAGEPFPVEPIRTLDAIHVATALRVAGALGPLTVVSSDRRVRENARALGFAVAP